MDGKIAVEKGSVGTKYEEEEEVEEEECTTTQTR